MSPATFPATAAITRVLEAAYPGSCGPIVRMRDQILDFVTSPTAKVVFLAGPSGVGKSTLARHIAYLKAYGISESADPEPLRQEFIRYSGPNLIDPRSMDGWYVELPLTGLVESIAESQLFGVAKGAYTGAEERSGVFELANQDEKAIEVKLTGGAVFLDEVGDLTPKLQSKLLPVLSNGAFYRVGGEGSPKHLIEYRGVVITASWRSIQSLLRSDLVARLTTHVIEVPGLHQRGADLDGIVRTLVTNAMDRFRTEMTRLRAVDGVAKGRLDELATAVAMPDDKTIQRLCKVDWSLFGQMRGLSNAIEKIVIQRRDPDEVIWSLPRLDGVPFSTPTSLSGAAESWTATEKQGLSDLVNNFEADARDVLKQRITNDADFCKSLADRLSITPTELKKHAANLSRDRRSR